MRMSRTKLLPPSKRTADFMPDGCPLSPREFEILQKVAAGRTKQQIALEMAIEPSTVRSAAHKAYARLGVSNAAQAVAAMYDDGWMDYVPLTAESRGLPSHFAAAYLEHFERWVRDPENADQDRLGMELALAGARI